MVKEFKFFRGDQKIINWGATGLLDGATNVPLLIRALDLTYKYIVDNNLIDNRTFSTLLLPIMTRLYRDKLLHYTDYEIRDKIDHVVAYLNSVAIRRILQELHAGAWTGIDVEAETCSLAAEHCKWEEGYGF